ncbi:hypothetical protein BJY52DRAFT_1216756 [Lactarius psammicola]|nr:hypothetical protein BJY52DRAFT_1216756 [Lactarius psammicola]
MGSNFSSQAPRDYRRTRPASVSFPIPTLFHRSAKTAILTNPTWVVKVRTFAASHNSPVAHRGLWSGFRAIFRYEVWGGLYCGTSLAQVGVSNGALQFMAYEKMKSWAFEHKRRRIAKLGCVWPTDDNGRFNTAHTVIFGAPTLGALCTTYYPYQVVPPLFELLPKSVEIEPAVQWTRHERKENLEINQKACMDSQ